MILTPGVMQRLTDSRRRLIEPEEAYRAPEPARHGNVSVVRYCAYRAWLPQLAQRCECWGCWQRRQRFAAQGAELRRRIALTNERKSAHR